MENYPVFDLSNQLSEISFVDMTIAQITKDFSRMSLDFNFVPNSEIDIKSHLISQIENATKKLNADKLQQFIYLVDVKETDFIFANQDSEFFNVLAQKILVREAYKVFLRKYYTS
jgi:hypothetical protein